MSSAAEQKGEPKPKLKLKLSRWFRARWDSLAATPKRGGGHVNCPRTGLNSTANIPLTTLDNEETEPPHGPETDQEEYTPSSPPADLFHLDEQREPHPPTIPSFRPLPTSPPSPTTCSQPPSEHDLGPAPTQNYQELTAIGNGTTRRAVPSNETARLLVVSLFDSAQNFTVEKVIVTIHGGNEAKVTVDNPSVRYSVSKSVDRTAHFLGAVLASSAFFF